MNGYERISATLSGEPTDRVPIMLHNFLSAAREAGLTMAQFRSSPEKMADAFIRASEKYGLDGILTDVDTAMLAHAMGAGVEFPEDIPAKVVASSGDTPDEIIEKLIAENLYRDERIQIYLEAIRILRSRVGGKMFIRGNADQGPFSLAVSLRGMVRFLMELHDPECEAWIFRLIERCYDVHIAFHRMVLEAGADMTSFGDSMSSPDLVSPKDYCRFALPFQQRLRRELSERNPSHRVVCHMCGNTTRILPDLVSVGFAGVELDYKTSIDRIVEEVRGRSVLFGPIDPSGVFCMGTPAVVAAETRNILDHFSKGGLVIGAGCALPAETPPENIHAFAEMVRNHAKLDSLR